MRSFRIIAPMLFFALALCAKASEDGPSDSLRIYIDADYSLAWQVAQSIEQGLMAALSTRAFAVGANSFEIVPLDHRANSRRSWANIERFIADEQGLVVVGGMHSPPYIRHLADINENGVPMLLAWSANGSLTRYSGGETNWIFRVSVDDSQAGPFIARQMVANDCERIGLVVLDNGWGQGNHQAMTTALQGHGITTVFDATMATEIGPARASQIATGLAENGATCLGIVGNDGTTAQVIEAIYAGDIDLQVFSHWGPLGGNFSQLTTHEMREAVDLQVIQTCGLEAGRRNDAMLETALEQARGLGQTYQELSDISAPAGFVHGFDLGLILMEAVAQAQTDDRWYIGAAPRRHALRDALEDLQTPVSGVLRHYAPPFSQVSEANPNGHEGLSGADLCMAAMDQTGRLIPVGGIERGVEDARSTQ